MCSNRNNRSIYNFSLGEKELRERTRVLEPSKTLVLGHRSAPEWTAVRKPCYVAVRSHEHDRFQRPGKVYLFGEHAVVYGEPAVPCAIERRASVPSKRATTTAIRVQAKDLSSTASPSNTGQRDEHHAGRGRSHTARSGRPSATSTPRSNRPATRSTRPDAGFDITVESDIPLGAGLGSSAAVIVAASTPRPRARRHALDRDEIADRAYQAEYEVQDGRSVACGHVLLGDRRRGPRRGRRLPQNRGPRPPLRRRLRRRCGRHR